MKSSQNFFTVAAVILLFSSLIQTEAKPNAVINLDGGNFGPIENRGNGEGEVEIQSYNGGVGGRVDPILSKWGTGGRQDLLQMSQLIKLLLEEIRNQRVQAETEIGKYPIQQLQSFGKRQIVYRQCFFNPISCF